MVDVVIFQIASSADRCCGDRSRRTGEDYQRDGGYKKRATQRGDRSPGEERQATAEGGEEVGEAREV